VRFWQEPLDRHELLLRHKTTYRPWYTTASETIEREGLFDILFVNREGEVCEGTRTNVFTRIRGKLYTPPVSCGLLPGTLRAHLLSRGECRERVLTREDLAAATAVFCGNSVRGLVRVNLTRS
jgi:branched-subunit amino acid aminotransferase/4-amino-4-deoxychorismate lyase